MIRRSRILLVDDVPETVDLLREIVVKEGHVAETAPDGETALKLAMAHPPDLVITDLNMPGMDGLELLSAVRRAVPDCLVIIATAYGSLRTAVDGIKAGAFDYLSKPFIVDDIRLVVQRALEHKQILAENRTLREQLKDRYRFENIVGSSPGMVAVYKLVARVAQSDTTVLLQGESGTGKELVARAIHANSSRSDGPFVVLDSGALAESLLESELFGHERGAFTGAVAAKRGLLEKAHRGTCFIDEVADISPALQGKLLRFLQEREIKRVGGNDPLSVDVRLIAASNKDLKSLVEAGKFRDDLYYRLNVVTIVLPSLRERPEDIPGLAQSFLQKYGGAKEPGVTGISPQAMALLTAYAWPGNVRELEHVIQRAVVLSPQSVIVPQDLPESIRSAPAALPAGEKHDWPTLEMLERDYIVRALEAHGQDLEKTAQVLGIHRKTLQRKLRSYGLSS